jgi:predicted site-specific integrase-resolvase
MASTPIAPETLTSLVTTAEAAELAGVSVGAIRIWVHRGHLTPVGRERGRLMYRWIDVAKAELATRKRARRRY